LADREWRRNFIAGVSSAFFLQIGRRTASDGMVLPLFINQTGDRTVLVGLIPTLSTILTRFPQLFVAGRLEGKRRKMPYFPWLRSMADARAPLAAREKAS
jgi:hypothetical protein